MLLKLPCKVDIFQSLIHRWENWGMLKLSSVPKATRSKMWAGNSNPDSLSPEPGFSWFFSNHRKEGTLSLWHWGVSHPQYTLTSACVRVHTCLQGQLQLAREHPGPFPAEDAGCPMHLRLGLSNPTYLFSRMGFWNPLAGGGQRQLSGSFPTHTPYTFLLGGSSYAGSIIPSVGILIYIIWRASMHTPRLDLTACCEGGLGSHRGGGKRD